MYAGVFVFAVLLAGTQGDSYGDVGDCKDIDADETFDYNNIYNIMYVHAVTKIAGSDLVDGIVVNITTLEDNPEIMFKSFEVHTKDGSVDTLYYQDIYMSNAVALEFIADADSNDTLNFNLIVIGQVPECGVLVFYKCAEVGTLSQDVTQVFKKDKAPLSDACEAKVAAIIKDQGVVSSPSYVLPYAANNYS